MVFNLAITLLGIMAVVSLLIVYMMLTELLNFIQTNVPFRPTAKKDLVDMIHRVGITSSDYVLDIGSGNGKALFIVEQLTGARVRGIQRAGWTQDYAKLRKLVFGSRVELISANFFDHSWAEATVIYGYLYPFLMQKVGEKALGECLPGTKLIIRDFPIPQLKASREWVTPTSHHMYEYVIENY